MWQAASSQASFIEFLQEQSRRDVLRFITCGSVDDGKSTLIGRLLHDASQLFDDQLERLKRDSRRFGTQDGDLDYALLVVGLAAEREQGITIDVAHRFFATERRCFIVADTPGHEQYTRNMATGASTADLAILLVDARRGISPQTRRHSLLLSMLGVRRIVLAINKMDLIGWSQTRFEAIAADYEAYASRLGFDNIVAIPMSALNGDNVVHGAVSAPWYAGASLLQHLEAVPLEDARAQGQFRLPVQWVNRRRSDFRGYAGLISSGRVGVGDPVVLQHSQQQSRVTRIVTADGDLQTAIAGQSVTLTLANDIDISRGDVITSPDVAPLLTDRISGRLFWAGERPLTSGRQVELKVATASTHARVERVERKINLDAAAAEPADRLMCNDIGDVVLALERPLVCEPYARNRELGSFILIERESYDTLALGLVQAPGSAGEARGVASRLGRLWRTLRLG